MSIAAAMGSAEQLQEGDDAALQGSLCRKIDSASVQQQGIRLKVDPLENRLKQKRHIRAHEGSGLA